MSAEAPLGHLDEGGQLCKLHEPVSMQRLLTLAVVGARTPSFNHDIASKLQGVMMALDELTELTDAHAPEIVQAVEVAHRALGELLPILDANRALTKPHERIALALGELVRMATTRVLVQVTTELPDLVVLVSPPTVVYAMSLVFDVAAGPGRSRTMALAMSEQPTHLELMFPLVGPPPAKLAEAFSLAAFVLEENGGALRCGGSHVVVCLPLVR
jgi:hypothetical protein